LHGFHASSNGAELPQSKQSAPWETLHSPDPECSRGNDSGSKFNDVCIPGNARRFSAAIVFLGFGAATEHLNLVSS